MKIGKKLLSFLLAMSVSLSAMQMTAWMEELPDDYVGNENSQVTDEFDYTDGYNVPAVMSLLPLEEKEKEVYLDYSNELPEFDENGVAKDEITVKPDDLIAGILADNGWSRSDVTVMYSFDSYNNNYTELTDEKLTIPYEYSAWSNDKYDQYGFVSHCRMYLIIGPNANDQLNAEQYRYTVNLYVKNYYHDFVENLVFSMYDEDGNSLPLFKDANNTYNRYVSYDEPYYYARYHVQTEDVYNTLSLKVQLPSNVSVYEEEIYTEAAMNVAKDITAEITGEGYKTSYGYTTLTFVITEANGLVFIPTNYYGQAIKYRINYF